MVELCGHNGDITKIASLQNEQLLLTSSKDNTLRLWNLDTFQCIHNFEGHNDWIRDFTISQDEKYVFSASDDWTIKQWDLTNKTLKSNFAGHTMAVTNVFVSNDCGELRLPHGVSGWKVKRHKIHD